MTKCHKCGVDQKNDIVDIMGSIAIVITMFCFGWLIRFNWLIHDWLYASFGYNDYPSILGPVFVVAMWGSFAFFGFALIVKFFER